MNPRDRRALRIGVAVILVAVLTLRIAPAGIGTLLRARRDLQLQTGLRTRVRIELAQGPALERELPMLRQRLKAVEGSLLNAKTAPRARVELIGRSRAALPPRGLHLQSIRVLDDSMAVGWLRRTSAELRLETDVRGLTEVLMALATDKAPVLIRRLEIEARNPGGASDLPEVLRVAVVLSAWFEERPGAGGGAVP